MPGGFGTIDELFESLTLVQTHKIASFPVVLVGSSFWSGLKDWIIEVMLEKEHNVNPEDMDLLPIMDDPDEIVTYINNFYAERGHQLIPNYTL